MNCQRCGKYLIEQHGSTKYCKPCTHAIAKERSEARVAYIHSLLERDKVLAAVNSCCVQCGACVDIKATFCSSCGRRLI